MDQNGIFVRNQQDAKRDFKVSGFSAVRHLRVCNQVMLAAVQNNKLVCRSLSSSTRQLEIPLPISSSDAISHVHLAPNGFYSIVSCKSGENFFINLKSNNPAPAPIKKLKDQISAVAWNPDIVKEADTGSILLGTVTGSIFETSFQGNGAISFFKEHAVHFGKADESGAPQPIVEMRLFIIEEESKTAKCVLFVCKPLHLYSLYATVSLVPVVRSYTSSASLQNFVSFPETPQHLFHPFFSTKDVQQTSISMPSIPDPPADAACALVFYSTSDTYTHPFRFFWLGPLGCTFGTVNLTVDTPRDIIHEDKHIKHRKIDGKYDCPVGATITEFHVLLAYSSRLVAHSLYTYDPVYEDNWPVDLGCAVGITSDPVSEFHWLHTTTFLLKYRPNDEGRYVWKIFLENGDYVHALKVAQERLKVDPDALELVLKRQADKYITDRNFTAAAEILAQSNDPFETVVLKFLSPKSDTRMGLKVLLEKKLEKLGGPEDRLKRDALVMWLLEIQLSELSQARRNEDIRAATELSTQIQHFTMKKPTLESIYTMREAVYSLCVSHADFDTKLFLAQQFQDYEEAISIYFLRKQYKEVLNILKTKCASAEAYLKYGSELIEHVPMEFYLSLLGNEHINPQAMLPLLYQCQVEKPQAMPTLKYLDWALTHPLFAHDVQLHNFYLLMLARHRTNRLLDYLMSKGRDKATVPYDIDFAIRTCGQYRQERSIIFLHCVNEDFQKAVEMALEIDLEYAKECARLMDPSEEDVVMGIASRYPKEVRRKIWLRIAAFIIDNRRSAEECISLLKESGDALCIQDIFPLFPAFTKIEHVKDSLCECLKDHSNTIKEIQQTLKEATDVSQEIKERTERLKNRVTVVRGGDHCAGCQRSLASRPFFPFACRHFFHRECLEEAMTSFLDFAAQQKLSNLIERERNILLQLDADDRNPDKKNGLTEREQRYEEIAEQISDILGAECPHCGSIAIEIVDRPFFSDVEYANDLDTW